MANKKVHKRKYLIAAAAFAVVLLAALILITHFRSKTYNPTVETHAKNTFDRTIVVVADVDFPPYTFLDAGGNPSGIDIEVINLLANDIGANVEYQLMEWSKCKLAIRNGEADIILGLEYTPDNEEFVIQTRAINNDPFICFGRNDFVQFSEIQHSSIATVEQGGAIADFIEPYRLTGNLTTYPTYTEAFQSVASGENDYAIARYSIGRRILSNLNNKDISIAGPALSLEPLTYGVNRDNAQLYSEIEASLMHFLSIGTIDGLSEKWLGDFVEIISFEDVLKRFNLPILITVLLGLTAIFVVIIYIFRIRERSARALYDETTRTLEYQYLLTDTTKGLYEDIYELDITHNCASGKETRNFFMRLGMPEDMPFDKALEIIAAKTIKEENQAAYLSTFNPEAVKAAYAKGVRSLNCDLQLLRTDNNYYWVRISGRIFYWNVDHSIRMITYRRNIDEERRREEKLVEEATLDGLTGVLNRAAAEAKIKRILDDSRPEDQHAMLMIDIDYFKTVNDTFGHDFGDYVLKSSARIISHFFRQEDVIGRVGGDEFVILIKGIKDEFNVQKRLDMLNAQLHRMLKQGEITQMVSASIGAAIFPGSAGNFRELYRLADAALYKVKESGRNGNFIYHSEPDSGNEAS